MILRSGLFAVDDEVIVGLPALIARLQYLYREAQESTLSTRVSVFSGKRLPITGDPIRTITLTDGTKVPINTAENQDEFDDGNILPKSQQPPEMQQL